LREYEIADQRICIDTVSPNRNVTLLARRGVLQTTMINENEIEYQKPLFISVFQRQFCLVETHRQITV